MPVHDPEMRHGHKSSSRRFDGHKAAIVVDTDSHLITAVDVLPGNAPDNLGAPDSRHGGGVRPGPPPPNMAENNCLIATLQGGRHRFCVVGLPLIQSRLSGSQKYLRRTSSLIVR